MTLNTNEYMGVEGDRAFHTKERYRVDNLIAPTHHQIKFEIKKEPMMMRVIGILHRHIEFDIELSQDYGNG